MSLQSIVLLHLLSGPIVAVILSLTTRRGPLEALVKFLGIRRRHWTVIWIAFSAYPAYQYFRSKPTAPLELNFQLISVIVFYLATRTIVADFFNEAGRVSTRTKEYGFAATSYLIGLIIYPMYPPLLTNLANAFTHFGRYGVALTLLHISKVLNSRWPYTYYNQALAVWWRDRDSQRALGYLGRAIDNFDGHYQQAVNLRREIKRR